MKMIEYPPLKPGDKLRFVGGTVSRLAYVVKVFDGGAYITFRGRGLLYEDHEISKYFRRI